MKKFSTFLIACSCTSFAFGQSQLDNYFNGSTTFTEIAGTIHGLTAPHDLDFVPTRPNEWWVLNKEANGGSVVIFWNPGKSNQAHQFRKDSHNDHFMARAVAIAMGENNEFVSAQEIKNTASASSTFMGPALWSSDTSIFARMHQNNWVTGQLLGSHIDMLHQSPFGMGVAYDNARVYWYFDGHNSNICKYNFGDPHGVGEDDHSDGRIHRYTDVVVTRKANVPSHMALDRVNNWLYIVDAGTNRIIRMKTNSGTVGANLTVPSTANEPLAEYKAVTGATVEVVVASGLTSPCGIDYRSGRIVVSDNATGNIHVYNVSGSMPATSVGTLITGGPGVMGVRIDNENKIWYVNNTTKKLMRIDNPNVLSIPEVSKNISYTIYPNPTSDIINIDLNEINGKDKVRIVITDITGKQVHSSVIGDTHNTISTSTWPKGIYMVNIVSNGNVATEKVVVQ
ncbi:MAG: T9SS type A sorting domain-containing protein [Chitinophagales bacterium]|nr:T9SS type A sorting domain-containing protein [Chitinophagales bacterium]